MDAEPKKEVSVMKKTAERLTLSERLSRFFAENRALLPLACCLSQWAETDDCMSALRLL